ncbi:hypothetical protein FOA52_013058 [Chlamydomonas sp. UWO 241]|nr:hypothetical protein FOA52_013058 [Chlamydomonas sp. UWO 241]
MVHLSILGQQALEIIKASIPRAVSSSPERYPFMMPSAVDSDGPSAAVRYTDTPEFAQQCNRATASNVIPRKRNPTLRNP